MSDATHSDAPLVRISELLRTWLVIVGATILYCELSQLTQNRPFVDPNVTLLWIVKVWAVWMVLSVALATERGRAAAVRLSGHPIGRLAFLLLPGLALAYEWGVGAIFDAAGWLGQEDSVWILIYRRLPLYAAAVLALAFVLSRRRASPRGSAWSKAGSSPTLTVTTSRGPVEIALDDIEAIIAAENYVELCLIDGRQYLHRATLMSMNELLSSNGIVRVHRSASINAAHVIERLPQRRLRLRSGRIVRVGRAFRDALPFAALPPSSRR